ncbi:MAG: sugar ABC transporter permease [Kouleothrix sp.]|jgi:multiple sugar transport system permease protein|nr:sugar ABC transporter permease [Kouleothrix sp.]
MQTGIKPLGGERLWLLVLLAPTLVGLLFGAIGSVLATTVISLLKWDLIAPPSWAGWANYTGLLTDTLFRRALGVTFAFSAMYVPGTVLLSLLIAILLNRKLVGIPIFRTIYFLPSVSSAVAVGLVWNWIFGKDRGVLNYLIESIGGQPINWLGPQYALYAVVLVNVWGAIGTGMIIFLAGLKSIPREYYESANIDGANGWQQFWRITLPLITPSIFFQTIIATINAFQAFEYVYILTRGPNGASNTPTLVFSIYRNGFNFFRMGSASAQALVLALIILTLTLVYFWLERRWVVYE